MKTIRQFLTAALVLAGLQGANAQSNMGEFKWGVKAGANFANFTNLEETIKDKKGKVGLVAGGFVKIPLSNSLSIRPELLFNMKGASFNFADSIVNDIEANYNLNYIEVPVSLDFDLFGLLDIHAGVQASYLLTRQLKINGTKLDIDLQKSEFGFHFGTGIDLGNLGIHARFQQSMSSFSKEDDFDPRNWGVSVTAALMLN